MRRVFIHIVLLSTFSLNGQNRGLSIGTESLAPDAIFQVESTDQGFLIPGYSLKVENNQKEKLYAPLPEDDGMFFYNTNRSAFEVFSNVKSIWYALDRQPKGIITIWTGDITEIPEGWSLCDGSNGTPDLRGRFIVGLGNKSEYDSPGKTGGEKAHLLTVNEIPQHSHEVIIPVHSHTGKTVHSHTSEVQQYEVNNSGGFSNKGNGGGPGATLVSSSEADLSGAKVIISPSNSISAIEETGQGHAHENRPKYYVVAFIMKE